ncbi:carboxylate-amine ligase [Nonomuraea endophytica]|uniref:Putative glutamate--cysteine ligase 2 n=1 Tax=Nonomuraea endophytica TaxID=714136 RepID=A0A7W8A9X2_9ACTN|nr:glutamate--cysteine ligase [Nonomuraea endophytica]MBB5082260.1 carboxylate-amine ligase [Nonomuraea endophytica]
MTRTVGVEEEFLLLDARSGEPVPAAGRVLSAVGGHPWQHAGGGFHQELFQTQVEAATGICTTLGDLHRQLQGTRFLLAAAAQQEGLGLVSVGTPVLAASSPRPSSGERFTHITGMYQGIVADYQSSGCHVHVGVKDRETAVAVINHLRPWLPTLLALSANSPFDRGRDSGYASWRTVQQSRFPGAGVTPWFDSAAAYDREVERLVSCGVLVDDAMSFWLARPGIGLPTVEVRAADAAGTADEAVLQAALTRALITTAESSLTEGREAPRVSDQVCAAAVWNAARYGLDGPGINPFEERSVHAIEVLDQLVLHVSQALTDSGDLPAVSSLLAQVKRAGTGAARQRRAAAGGLGSVIEMLKGETMDGQFAWQRAQTYRESA